MSEQNKASHKPRRAIDIQKVRRNDRLYWNMRVRDAELALTYAHQLHSSALESYGDILAVAPKQESIYQQNIALQNVELTKAIVINAEKLLEEAHRLLTATEELEAKVTPRPESQQLRVVDDSHPRYTRRSSRPS